MTLTVLITGFGPFPRAPFNPSAALAHGLARLRRPAFAEVRRVGHVFATCYEAVDEELPALLSRHRPQIVLMFGLATRTPFLRVETRARNVRSPILPDAAGRTPADRRNAAGAASVAAGRAPFVRLVTAARAARVPARLSRHAGAYLCNALYWRALEQAAARGPALVVFVHVPQIRRAPRRRGEARGLTAADLLRAGEAVLRALLAAARREPRAFASAPATAAAAPSHSGTAERHGS